jgi:hypothetical protein
MNTRDILADIGEKYLKSILPEHEFVIIAVKNTEEKVSAISYTTTLYPAEIVKVLTKIVETERLEIT